jgi:hypothetical protein
MYNDHGARNLCLQTGRWTGVDELAQQYYSSSTFCFVDNNPITRVDLNGKDWDIVFEEGKDGSKKYTLTFTGKVLNESKKEMTPEKQKEYAERMTSAIEKAFTGKSKDGKTTWSTSVNLTWAQKESDVGENDHIIRIKDADKMPTSKKNPSNKSLPLDGHSKIPSREISINADILNNNLVTGKSAMARFSDKTGLNGEFQATLERTVAHEAGHSGGLYHPEDQMKQEGNGYISKQEYDAFPENRNLMYQSSNRPFAGFYLIERQIKIMYETNKKD